jgi:hypothetical protein
LAVVLKINPGFDASYPWREIGTGDAAAKSPLEYYLAPADKGGEPPGRWAGRGLAMLGFADGAVIDRTVFEPLFGQHADPRDPSGGTRLGRAPQRFAAEDDIYHELVAAEPQASEARRAELRTVARAQTRHAVPFWDVTVSVSKSVTLFYGGLLARAEQARQPGRHTEADHYERQAARVWQAIMIGNAAALEYLQDEAGMTRTGYRSSSCRFGFVQGGLPSGDDLLSWSVRRAGWRLRGGPATGRLLIAVLTHEHLWLVSCPRLLNSRTLGPRRHGSVRTICWRRMPMPTALILVTGRFQRSVTGSGGRWSVPGSGWRSRAAAGTPWRGSRSGTRCRTMIRTGGPGSGRNPRPGSR